MKLNFIIAFLLLAFSALSQKMMSFEEKKIPQFNLIDTGVINFCSGQSEYRQLNESERKFYYWVNYSRKNPKKFYDSIVVPIARLYPQLQDSYLTSLKTDLSNTVSLPLLKLSPVLRKMAKAHSIDITSHNSSPSHNSTNGEVFSDRFKKARLKKCGGENIGYGSDNPVFLLTLLYLDINVPSLGHRKALLNPAFTETGIGNSSYKNSSVFLVEDFACSQN